MHIWAKRGIHTALVTGGLLMLGTGIASADENVDPDRPASPLDAPMSAPVKLEHLSLPNQTPALQSTLKSVAGPGVNQLHQVGGQAETVTGKLTGNQFGLDWHSPVPLTPPAPPAMPPQDDSGSMSGSLDRSPGDVFNAADLFNANHLVPHGMLGVTDVPEVNMHPVAGELPELSDIEGMPSLTELPGTEALGRDWFTPVRGVLGQSAPEGSAGADTRAEADGQWVHGNGSAKAEGDAQAETPGLPGTEALNQQPVPFGPNIAVPQAIMERVLAAGANAQKLLNSEDRAALPLPLVDHVLPATALPPLPAPVTSALESALSSAMPEIPGRYHVMPAPADAKIVTPYRATPEPLGALGDIPVVGQFTGSLGDLGGLDETATLPAVGQLPVGQLPVGQLPVGQLPVGQLPGQRSDSPVPGLLPATDALNGHLPEPAGLPGLPTDQLPGDTLEHIMIGGTPASSALSTVDVLHAMPRSPRPAPMPTPLPTSITDATGTLGAALNSMGNMGNMSEVTAVLPAITDLPTGLPKPMPRPVPKPMPQPGPVPATRDQAPGLGNVPLVGPAVAPVGSVMPHSGDIPDEDIPDAEDFPNSAQSFSGMLEPRPLVTSHNTHVAGMPMNGAVPGPDHFRPSPSSETTPLNDTISKLRALLGEHPIG